MVAYTASMCLRASMLDLTELAKSAIANVSYLARLYTVVARMLFDANCMLTAKLMLVL